MVWNWSSWGNKRDNLKGRNCKISKTRSQHSNSITRVGRQLKVNLFLFAASFVAFRRRPTDRRLEDTRIQPCTSNLSVLYNSLSLSHSLSFIKSTHLKANWGKKIRRSAKKVPSRWMLATIKWSIEQFPYTPPPNRPNWCALDGLDSFICLWFVNISSVVSS